MSTSVGVGSSSNDGAAGNNDNKSKGVDGGGEQEGEAQLLVSEFPPPPYYYRLASENKLSPPPIPTSKLERGSRRAAAAAAAAKAESERLRLEGTTDQHDTDAILGGVTKSDKKDSDGNNDDDDGSVVAVFGEIVEDPLLVQIEENEYEDPKLVRDEVSRLNMLVVKGFVKLVQELVNDPLNNKKCRDELSHNVFLMLQECNKFREHQAREILINVLEEELEARQNALSEIKGVIDKSTKILNDLENKR